MIYVVLIGKNLEEVLAHQGNRLSISRNKLIEYKFGGEDQGVERMKIDDVVIGKVESF